MPIRTETYDLAAEYDDLTEQIADLGDELDEYDADTPHHEQLANTRALLSLKQQGLERFSDLHPDCGEVVFGELNAAEYAAVEKHLPADHGEQERRIVMTAVGAVEAPWVVAGDVTATIEQARDTLPAYFLRWSTPVIDGLMNSETPEDSNPFRRGTDAGDG